MEIMRFLIFTVRLALVLSRPIGQEAEEKHEALTGDREYRKL